ncbi:uncharacterized protein TNCV_462731 [Trichonephila clavipes]|nr:uncharacterized protein TNCV_462731 [Trichonephila clavipes]
MSLYHIHHIWHYRVRLRESGQPIERLRKTCKNAFPRTIPVSFGRLDTPIATESSLNFTCRNCGGGDRGRVTIYRPFGEVSLSLNRTVTCMVLKANDRRTSCPCHDEFRGPRSDYVRQVALATTTTTHSLHNRRPKE